MSLAFLVLLYCRDGGNNFLRDLCIDDIVFNHQKAKFWKDNRSSKVVLMKRLFILILHCNTLDSFQLSNGHHPASLDYQLAIKLMCSEHYKQYQPLGLILKPNIQYLHPPPCGAVSKSFLLFFPFSASIMNPQL